MRRVLMIPPAAWLIGSLIGYVSLAWSASLWANWGGLFGLYQFTPDVWLGLGYVGLISLLYAFYWRVSVQLNQGEWQPSIAQLFSVSAVLAIPTAFVYPFNANDIFRYALRGRITAIYDGNPYTQPPSQFPQDFFTALAGEWVTATTPYGPVWELIAAVVAWLGQHALFWHVILLKFVSLAAFWGIGWLIWQAMAENEASHRLRYTFLWWGNPALLLTFGVDGHNDSLMLFWLVLGWVVWRIGRQHLDWRWLWFGLLIMWLAPLTKVIALLAIPFFAIASWRVLPTWRDRLILAFVTAMSYAASAVLIFLPFGSVATYIARLANEATGGVSFSPVAMVILATRALGYSFNFGGIGPYLLVELALVAFVLGILTWWPGRNPERGAADLLFAYTT